MLEIKRFHDKGYNVYQFERRKIKYEVLWEPGSNFVQVYTQRFERPSPPNHYFLSELPKVSKIMAEFASYLEVDAIEMIPDSVQATR